MINYTITKDVPLSQLLLVAHEATDKPADELAQRELDLWKGKILIREFLPLREKEACLLQITCGLDLGTDIDIDQDLGSINMAANLEASLVRYGLLAYTNIMDDLEAETSQFAIYDYLSVTGIKDYILGYCQRDYDQLDHMIHTALSFDNMFNITETICGFNPDTVELLVKSLAEMKDSLDKETLQNLVKVINWDDPVTATLKEGITDSLIKTVTDSDSPKGTFEQGNDIKNNME